MQWALRVAYAVGVCMLVAACGIGKLCADQWRLVVSTSEMPNECPGVVEMFRVQQEGRDRGDLGKMDSPLLAQAEALGAYLNPPVPVAVEKGITSEMEVSELLIPASETLVQVPPTLQEAAPDDISPKFRVVAVSCYSQRPERSMALIEPTIGGEAKWVKEGTPVGHFVVHEIRQGLVILRNGEQLCELTVERNPAERTLVRDVRPGSRQVSAAGLDDALMPETRSETDR